LTDGAYTSLSNGDYIMGLYDESVRGTCASTCANAKNWFRVDLGSSHDIESVTVVSRDYGAWSMGMTIRIGASGSESDAICKSNVDADMGEKTTSRCDNVLSGRYISIWKTNDALMLCELQAFTTTITTHGPDEGPDARGTYVVYSKNGNNKYYLKSGTAGQCTSQNFYGGTWCETFKILKGADGKYVIYSTNLHPESGDRGNKHYIRVGANNQCNGGVFLDNEWSKKFLLEKQSNGAYAIASTNSANGEKYYLKVAANKDAGFVLDGVQLPQGGWPKQFFLEQAGSGGPDDGPEPDPDNGAVYQNGKSYGVYTKNGNNKYYLKMCDDLVCSFDTQIAGWCEMFKIQKDVGQPDKYVIYTPYRGTWHYLRVAGDNECDGLTHKNSLWVKFLLEKQSNGAYSIASKNPETGESFPLKLCGNDQAGAWCEQFFLDEAR